MHTNIVSWRQTFFFFNFNFFLCLYPFCFLWNRLRAAVYNWAAHCTLMGKGFFACNVHLHHNVLSLFQYPIDFFGVSWSLLYLSTSSQCANARPRYQEVNSLALPLPVCLWYRGSSNDHTKQCKNTDRSGWFHNASKSFFSLPKWYS